MDQFLQWRMIGQHQRQILYVLQSAALQKVKTMATAWLKEAADVGLELVKVGDSVVTLDVDEAILTLVDIADTRRDQIDGGLQKLSVVSAILMGAIPDGKMVQLKKMIGKFVEGVTQVRQIVTDAAALSYAMDEVVTTDTTVCLH